MKKPRQRQLDPARAECEKLLSDLTIAAGKSVRRGVRTRHVRIPVELYERLRDRLAADVLSDLSQTLSRQTAWTRWAAVERARARKFKVPQAYNEASAELKRINSPAACSASMVKKDYEQLQQFIKPIDAWVDACDAQAREADAAGVMAILERLHDIEDFYIWLDRFETACAKAVDERLPLSAKR